MDRCKRSAGSAGSGGAQGAQAQRAPDAYRATARYYDLVYAEAAPRDVPFYLELAEKCGGPVLELGCGTGRVSLPLARAGHRVVGLDSSDAMLAVLDEKLAAEPAEVRGRVELVPGDMERLDLPGRFALIIAPFRAFQHVLTPEGQRECLTAIRRHLTPGGRFVYNAFNPSLKYIVGWEQRGASWQMDHECLEPSSGHMVRRSYLCRYHPARQVNDLRFKYEVYDAQGALCGTRVEETQMRWQYRWEAQYLLELCGFTIEAAYGGYDKAPLDERAGELIFVCGGGEA